MILHHIGGGQNLEELKNKLVTNNIEFVAHGPIFDVEGKELVFSQCNLGLNLPKEEIQSSMSLKSIEYMRSGLPFVNSGIGDNWKIVEKYNVGLNCSSKNVKQIAERIIQMNHFDYEKMHHNVMNCYDRLFGTPDYYTLFAGVPNIHIKE